jgi:hypothetical protein
MLSLPEPCRIYAPDGELFALVDEVDFAWAARWRWSPKWSRGGSKVYMRRVFQISLGGSGAERNRRQVTVWLHREILMRMRVAPPSPEHVLAGHGNGDELDCRRANLLWETHSSNNRNRRPNGATLRRRLGL